MLPDRIEPLGGFSSRWAPDGTRVLYQPCRCTASYCVTSVSVSRRARPDPPGARFSAGRPLDSSRRAGMMCSRKRKAPAVSSGRGLEIRCGADGTARRGSNALDQKDVTLDNTTPRTPTGQPGQVPGPRASSARPFPPAWPTRRPKGGRA